MNEPIKVGLTIGKFAPLHTGHIDMLKFALSVVDQLFVIIYDAPDKTNVSLGRRAGWIKEVFPDERVIVIQGHNAPNRHEDTKEVREMQEWYIGSVVSAIRLTHFISSEKYGEHLSQYLGVKNVIYDQERLNRNISSTMIRNNPSGCINYIPPNVLKDLSVDFTEFAADKIYAEMR